MTTSIILTVINIVLAWFFYYRIGKQSVINDGLEYVEAEDKIGRECLGILQVK